MLKFTIRSLPTLKFQGGLGIHVPLVPHVEDTLVYPGYRKEGIQGSASRSLSAFSLGNLEDWVLVKRKWKYGWKIYEPLREAHSTAHSITQMT